MRISYERLRDAGFHVMPDNDGVVIEGSVPFPFELTRKFLDQFGLTDGQTDQMIGEIATSVELHQIFNAMR